MQKTILSLTALAIASVFGHMNDASADDGLLGWLENGSISGDERLYNFSRDFAGTASNTPATTVFSGPKPLDFKDQNALSLGGKLKAQTGNWDGVSAAIALYYAYDIGGNNYTYNNKPYYNVNYGYPYLNPFLMGAHRTLDTLGEAWLQYQNSVFSVRGGRELIDNPWVNSSDGFMIPNIYQGASLQVTPTPELTLNLDRVNEYKNRTTADFNQNTLDVLPYDKLIDYGNTGGTFDAGATWKTDQAHLSAWLYDFNNMANMGYLEGGYRFPEAQQVFFANGQYVREVGTGVIGSVNADIYGIKTGMDLDHQLGSVFVAYNASANNTVNSLSATPVSTVSGIVPSTNGNFYSPYTQIYNTDPLYTTVMNYGLVSARAAGYAWMLGSTLHLMGHSLDITPTISEYYTAQNYLNKATNAANVRAYMLTSTWHFSGKLKGLTLLDQFGVEHDAPLLGTSFVENRFRLQYNF